MAEIMDAVHKNFALLPDAEVSVECNPGTVTAQKFAVYRQSGINRISLGLQSAQNVELKMLGRIHTFPSSEMLLHQIANFVTFFGSKVPFCLPFNLLNGS